MNLIAILIGLTIERLATRFLHWRRMRWLDRIIDSGFRQAEKLANWPALIPVIVLAVLLVLPVAGVIYSLGDTLRGFTYLFLAILVLLFSIGPRDIGEEIDEYCAAVEDGDEEQIQHRAKSIIEDEVPGDERARIQRVEEAVCVQANNRLFAIVFWFVVLGPLAAWAYRVTDLIRRRAVFTAARSDEEAGAASRIRDAAEMLHGWVAWIPARLTAVGYVAAGHADDAIAALRAPTEEKGATTSEHSEHLLARVGTAALALQDRSGESLTERAGARGAGRQQTGFPATADLGCDHCGDDVVRHDAVKPASLVLAALLAACGQAQPPEPADKSTRRIVSLAPNLTELVYTIGAGDLLVGVSAWSDFPPEVLELPVVGDAFTVDQEQLRLAAPDLLLVWESGTPEHTIDELRSAGFNVASIRTRGLDDIAAAMTALGELTGMQEEAARAATAFRSQLQALRNENGNKVPISVFYQVSARPLYTINREHYISELIDVCGGDNIFSDLTELAPTVDVEAVVDRNPEVMLASTDAGDGAFDEWQRWPELAANRLGNQFQLPADEIGRPTMRVLAAGRAMCTAIDRGRTNRARASAE